ncbi:hypothetical protein [Thalassospira marina]|uniref:Uncharacterized protein n=1 Tax=Thalassospira marina TaxID=2048283 RepID=A0A2N3KGR8_9PROT|nr:hypothetical protein [Thalassospira marina]PKR49653.1 hypothetical protein COO20_21715 [Thalassospira marina]
MEKTGIKSLESPVKLANFRFSNFKTNRESPNGSPAKFQHVQKSPSHHSGRRRSGIYRLLVQPDGVLNPRQTARRILRIQAKSARTPTGLRAFLWLAGKDSAPVLPGPDSAYRRRTTEKRHIKRNLPFRWDGTPLNLPIRAYFPAMI